MWRVPLLRYTPEILSTLSNLYNQLIETSFSESYGRFFSITNPVIECDIVTIIISKTKEAIPVQWIELQTMLGYTNAQKVAKQSHLVKKTLATYYFFLLVSLS